MFGPLALRRGALRTAAGRRFSTAALSQEPTLVSTLPNQLRVASESTGGENNFSPGIALKEFGEVTARAVAIQFPIAMASFVETIENVELAKIDGDEFNVNEAMLADGLGTMFGALCGAVMPTTVYIGHVRHKVAGAKWFYSFFNGFFYFLLVRRRPHSLESHRLAETPTLKDHPQTRPLARLR